MPSSPTATAAPNAPATSDRRRRTERRTPPATSRTAITASQSPRNCRTRTYVLTLPTSSDLMSVMSVWISGRRPATSTPRSTSCCLTRSITGARSSVTASSVSSTAPPPLPVSALSTARCARRLPSVHTFSKESDAATVRARSWTRPRTASSSEPPRRPSAFSRRGRSSGDTPDSRADRSSRVMRASVTRSATASWTAGSEASGATVSTYRSVSPTWSDAQAATTESGASRQPRTMRTAARQERPRCRGGRARSCSSAATRSRRALISEGEEPSPAPMSAIAPPARPVCPTVRQRSLAGLRDPGWAERTHRRVTRPARRPG